MKVELLNPYRDARGEWVRANLHGHSREHSGCASVPLSEGARMYHDLGAHVMAVTDHDHVTDLDAMRAAYPDMVFLHGFEHSREGHLLFIGESVPPLYLFPVDAALTFADGLLTIAAHPQPQVGAEHWNRSKIEALPRLPDGIEIYDGHYGTARLRARGTRPQYTALWDELLTSGLRLWGFANDDFHDPVDFDNAFNMLLVEELSPAAVVCAAKEGRCYASTGLMLKEVWEEGGHVMVEVGTPCAGRFVGPGGRALAQSQGLEFEYQVTDEAYVRFEAEAECGQLFLQPMFGKE